MRFEIHNTFPDQYAQEWDTLLKESVYNLPFLKYQYQKLWWQSRGAGEWSLDARLLLITAHQDQQLVGVAPLFITPDGFIRLLGSIEITDYLHVIVKEQHLEEFITGVFQELANLEWQSLLLQNIFDDAALIPAIEQAAQAAGWQYSLEPLEVAPSISLNGDWEAYLANVKKKQRHEIRRKLRRADESELQVIFKFINEEAEIPQAMQHVFTLMRHDADKVNFLTPQMETFFEQLALWAHQEGILSLAFLEINGQPAACNFSFDYDNQIWLYNSGISPEYQQLSPGWVILGKLIQWCAEQGKTRFDFMRGDEEYKYRFGAANRHLVQLTISR
ncbi:MAG: GNAT family N-acetyltransferase [Anaerolineaceae bacterium]|nr:GNAT family N-acetyltransferase [Anaerolineaceae bacterium]